jgi:hypothetical protein
LATSRLNPHQESSMSTEIKSRSRRWLWFFVAVGVASAAAVTWLALHIRSQVDPAKQLTLEQLRAARQLWEEKGPKDYQMLYKVRRGGDSQVDTYYVEVRGGQVVSVVYNSTQHLEPSKYTYHSMSGLFNDIERFLKLDAQPNSPQTFRRGYFDSDDGHLLKFERQVIGGPERVQIWVETFKRTAAR